MTQAQLDAQVCGLVPEEHDAKFFAQHLCAYLFIKPWLAGRRVLEVGFGSGYGADALAEAAAEVVAVDVVAGNVPRAQERYRRSNLQFRHMDATALPLPDNSFDVVCSFQVIEHVPEPQLPAFVSELARVLKPDGRCCISTLNLEQAMKPGKPYHKLCYHEKEFTGRELQRLLAQHFPSVAMHGLYPTATQRVYQRLKRWGLMKWGPERYNPVARFYAHAGVRAFTTKPYANRRALDLYAVCRK